MSQIYKATPGGGTGPFVMTLTGNTGGPIAPTANNINILGAPGVDVVGNPLTSTLTISITNSANAYVNVVGPTTYNVLLTDFFISVDATAGNVTIVLPLSPGTNQEFVVKDRLGQATNHLISVTTQGADTIDGQANYLFTDPYESIDILFHGNNFEIF